MVYPFMAGDILSICTEKLVSQGVVSMRRIIEIPPPVSEEHVHAYTIQQQNQEANLWIDKHSTQNEQESPVKDILDCPFCKRRLRIPHGYQGNVKCPQCNKYFTKNSRGRIIKKGKKSSLGEGVVHYLLFEAAVILIVLCLMGIWFTFSILFR
ncbi:MAG TPA: hypothetical protein D7I07_00110 [Candidatus Poseidoniales archaeon]|nr:MAG TPA: hypothetical protein D7I07_00110 [Candidatus Poseidoniales archaeon]